MGDNAFMRMAAESEAADLRRKNVRLRSALELARKFVNDDSVIEKIDIALSARK